MDREALEKRFRVHGGDGKAIFFLYEPDELAST